MQSPSYHAAQAASLPAAQSLTEKEACGSTALHLANVHLCFLLESIAFFTSPGLFTQTSCSLTTRIAFFAILLTAQMSAVSLGVWWEPSPDPTQPSQQLLRKEIEAMLGSGVRGAGGLAGVWVKGGRGPGWGPLASPAQGLQPLREDSSGPPGRNQALSRKQGERDFSSQGEEPDMKEWIKPQAKVQIWQGGGRASSRETLRGFPCGLSKAHSSAAFGPPATRSG